jgi:hypothetical protein
VLLGEAEDIVASAPNVSAQTTSGRNARHVTMPIVLAGMERRGFCLFAERGAVSK